MFRLRPEVIAFSIVFLAAPAFGAAIYVPDDQPTIQAAINAANQGDTIIVRPGTYVENLDLLGKTLTLKSEQGPGATTIDGGDPSGPDSHSVVLIRGDQGPDSVLEGFTITNGWSSTWYDEDAGVFCDGASPTIRGNVISHNIYEMGGGIICVNGASPLIENNLIEFNHGENGAGVLCRHSSPTLRGNVIQDNLAEHSGGGIHLLYGSAVLTGNTISRNEVRGDGAWHGKGGGLYCVEAVATISDCVFEENRCDEDGGGAAFIYCPGAVSRCRFTGNTAGTTGHSARGGGIYCSPVECFSITDCIISNNQCLAGSGGGLYMSKGSLPGVAWLTGCSIVGNSAAGDGGGAWINSFSGASITACTIGRNSAGDYGGGLFFYSEASPLRVANCLIYGNCANLDGGGLQIEGELEVASTTIAANQASYFGGAIFCAALRMSNSIAWANEAAAWPEIYCRPTAAVISYSSVAGGFDGTGNIDADPLFADPGRGDFHLPFDSPCKDAGSNALVPDGLLTDYEGDPRIYQDAVDMGADEWHPHLYSVGAVVPGGAVDVKVVGLPGAPAVFLALGSGILDPPRPTMYGDLYLEKPLRALLFLGKMPASGILVHPGVVPTSWCPEELHPLQALVGPRSHPLTRLTNLMVVEVE